MSLSPTQHQQQSLLCPAGFLQSVPSSGPHGARAALLSGVHIVAAGKPIKNDPRTSFTSVVSGLGLARSVTPPPGAAVVTELGALTVNTSSARALQADFENSRTLYSGHPSPHSAPAAEKIFLQVPASEEEFMLRRQSVPNMSSAHSYFASQPSPAVAIIQRHHSHVGISSLAQGAASPPRAGRRPSSPLATRAASPPRPMQVASPPQPIRIASVIQPPLQRIAPPVSPQPCVLVSTAQAYPVPAVQSPQETAVAPQPSAPVRILVRSDSLSPCPSQQAHQTQAAHQTPGDGRPVRAHSASPCRLPPNQQQAPPPEPAHQHAVESVGQTPLQFQVLPSTQTHPNSVLPKQVNLHELYSSELLSETQILLLTCDVMMRFGFLPGCCCWLCLSLMAFHRRVLFQVANPIMFILCNILSCVLYTDTSVEILRICCRF